MSDSLLAVTSLKRIVISVLMEDKYPQVRDLINVFKHLLTSTQTPPLSYLEYSRNYDGVLFVEDVTQCYLIALNFNTFKRALFSVPDPTFDGVIPFIRLSAGMP